MSDIKNLNGIFFFGVLGLVIYLCYLIFQPFLTYIFIAGAVSVTFYRPYKKLLGMLNGRKNLAAGLTCLGILLMVVVPMITFIGYLSKSSIDAYTSLSGSIVTEVPHGLTEIVGENFQNLDIETFVQEQFGTIVTNFNKWLVGSVTAIVQGATEVVTGLLIVMMTTFFLLRDGKRLFEWVIHLTPLADEYDREIFNKFREVSYSALVSTVVTGVAQGIVAGVAYIIVGVPFLLLTFATIFASFIPFVGASLVWGPIVIYLLLTQMWWQAAFLTAWGVIVVGLVDNLMRPLLMQGKTQVHPMILFFAIFGGIVFFGFWGIIFGPLIISIALTLLHIYEIEYCGALGLADSKTCATRRNEIFAKNMTAAAPAAKSAATRKRGRPKKVAQPMSRKPGRPKKSAK